MTTRKNFIGGMLAAGAAPVIVPASVFGANAPSNRITLGGMGVGGIGKNQLPLCRDVGFEVVSMCDLDWKHSEKVFGFFPQARTYKDWREFLEKEADRCDAMYCGAPDHWHALMCLAALKLKKPLCCVKPLTRRVDECRLVVAAAKKAGVATQVTACTSQDEASIRLKEIIDSGVLGKIKEVHAWSRRPVWPQGMTAYADWENPVPEGFDWNMWCGPAKRIPFADRWQGIFFVSVMISSSSGRRRAHPANGCSRPVARRGRVRRISARTVTIIRVSSSSMAAMTRSMRPR